MLKDRSGLPLNQREFEENSITYFSLNKITEVALVFHLTHSYLQFRHSQASC